MTASPGARGGTHSGTRGTDTRVTEELLRAAAPHVLGALVRRYGVHRSHPSRTTRCGCCSCAATPR